ncbi:hypothetical protein BDV41DRAFT_400178 [Aspergillus transmontanensis]|uniref:Uncharacterized protein n=1 Tax=Aspergillus transmontanensis TaxID=1034304 RepID=A0A5N6VP85_9EURO|nr:hypothetical protein BDV41DRAFT_400178 [Aspergillus transmontanensis]
MENTTAKDTTSRLPMAQPAAVSNNSWAQLRKYQRLFRRWKIAGYPDCCCRRSTPWPILHGCYTCYFVEGKAKKTYIAFSSCAVLEVAFLSSRGVLLWFQSFSLNT